VGQAASFDGLSWSYITVAHNAAFELAEGSIEFGFNSAQLYAGCFPRMRLAMGRVILRLV